MRQPDTEGDGKKRGRVRGVTSQMERKQARHAGEKNATNFVAECRLVEMGSLTL